MRTAALHNLDQFLSWSINDRLKVYPLAQPLQAEEIRVDIPEVREFSSKYSYFSEERPIIAQVSSDPEDIELTCRLLSDLSKYNLPEKYGEIAIPEILTKVLAYRDLKIGQKVTIPGQGDFVVDALFDIWHGMPAFGLGSLTPEFSSILLFRGTEFSLTSQRAWASLMSDLDLAGPGLTAFHNAQEQIRAYLQTKSDQGKKAIVMGYSLGGALASYTFIYENTLIEAKGSVAICAPGISEKVLEDWNALSEDRQSGFTSYVNSGDVVSKVGKLFGTTYCLSLLDPLKPLSAHIKLMCGEPLLIKALVDVV